MHIHGGASPAEGEGRRPRPVAQAASAAQGGNTLGGGWGAVLSPTCPQLLTSALPTQVRTQL